MKILTGAAARTPQPAPVRKIRFFRPYLYPKQKAAFFNAFRYSVIEASTKAGKTAGGIWLIDDPRQGRP
jgi:hypothetical protein